MDNDVSIYIENVLYKQVVSSIEPYLVENMNNDLINKIKNDKNVLVSINKFIYDFCVENKTSKEDTIKKLREIMIHNTQEKNKIHFGIIEMILKTIEEPLER